MTAKTPRPMTIEMAAVVLPFRRYSLLKMHRLPWIGPSLDEIRMKKCFHCLHRCCISSGSQLISLRYLFAYLPKRTAAGGVIDAVDCMDVLLAVLTMRTLDFDTVRIISWFAVDFGLIVSALGVANNRCIHSTNFVRTIVMLMVR